MLRSLVGSEMCIRDRGDFGLAKENVTENPALTVAGTPAYLPPEISARKGASKASDIYSLGATFYELIVGSPPYYDKAKDSMARPNERGQLKFPGHVSGTAKDLITCMMQRAPQKRLEISQIKRHAFFRKFDWDALLSKRMKAPN